MKRMKSLGKIGILPLLVLLLVSCHPSPEKGREKLRIAVIPKGTTHEFWKSIHAGAIKASRALGVEIVWKGPQNEDDRDQQLTLVEDFVNRGVDGIVLAPLDDKALMRPVAEAKRAGIPTVIIDSSLGGNDPVSFVATDNYRGGVLAAERLGALLEGKGKIFLIRHMEGSASTEERERGFEETMKRRFPEVLFLSSDQYGGATTEVSYRLLENLLNRFPQVEGIFCPNESTTFGALRALQDTGLAGKIKFVGFDSSEKLVEGLKLGHIHGLVVQNPFRMGYEGVKNLVAHIRKGNYPPRVDTGATLVTQENMNDPNVKALLLPDLTPYL